MVLYVSADGVSHCMGEANGHKEESDGFHHCEADV